MLGSRISRRIAPAVLFVTGLGVACSSSKTSSNAGVVARFSLPSGAAPAFLDVPFPSDAYLANGKIVDPLPGVEKLFKLNSQFLTHELAKENGFSRTAMSLFYVDDAAAPLDDNGEAAPATIDLATLPKSEADCVSDASSVFLLDLAAPDPAHARVACRAAFHDDRVIAASRPLLAVGPARGVLLEEAHAYAAVVTSRVKDAGGRALGASADFRAVAAGDHGTAVRGMYSDAIAKARAALGAALAADGAEIVAIAPFTTQKITDTLYQMRDALEDAPAPTLAWDAATMAPMGAARFAAKVNGALPAGFTASLDDWLGVVASNAKLADGTDDPDAELPVRAHDEFAAVGSAVWTAINYLQVKPGGYDTLDHATLSTDASGAPVPPAEAPTTKIWVTLAIPSSPMPASGYPVVVVGHGLGSSRAYLLDMGNTWAQKGWAVAAIDGITFGARAPETKYQVDKTTSYAGKNGAAYAGPDGIADEENGPIDFFGNLKNMGAFRDQFREQGFDVAQLVKLLRSAPDLSPLDTGSGAPKLDGDKIAYFGDSFGGITGATAAAIEPHVRAWFLNVAGGGIFTEVAAHGPGIAASLAAGATFNFRFGPDRFDESHPLNVIGQTLAAAGDPIEYAPMLVTRPHALKGASTSPRNIIQTEVIYDELVANEGGEALARAAGMGRALPNVGSNAGVVDVKNLASAVGPVPLADVAPDAAGGIHDTPVPGVTAVVVQVSPGQHGYDAVRRRGKRSYAIPYGRTDGSEPFVRLDSGYYATCPYRELQAMATRFFDDAFAGKTPVVIGFKPPVRDADSDGVTDDVDGDPNDPTKK